MQKLPLGAKNPTPGSSKANKTGSWRILRPDVDYEKCTKKCYFCFEFCPDSAIKRTKGGPQINYNYCKGCGICSYECPKKAITMASEEK